MKALSTCERIEEGLKPTLASILNDIKNDDWSCLYFASDIQIGKLINSGKICEDFFSRHQNYQEEMRCMFAECL